MFLSQYGKRNSNNWHCQITNYFHVKKEFYFEFLMPSFVFHFDKKWKKRGSSFFFFFIFMKELKNELLKQINVNFMTIYGLNVIQKQVRVKSPDILRCTMVTQAPRIRCLENNWCILIFILLDALSIYSFDSCFILIVIAIWNVLAEVVMMSCSSKDAPKFSHKLFKNHESWFKI